MFEFFKGYGKMLAVVGGPVALLVLIVVLVLGWIYGLAVLFTIMLVPINPFTFILFFLLLAGGTFLICSFFYYLADYKGWI